MRIAQAHLPCAEVQLLSPEMKYFMQHVHPEQKSKSATHIRRLMYITYGSPGS